MEGFELGPLQHRLWRLHDSQEYATPYYCQVEVSIEGRLDAEMFGCALSSVVAANEILRTNFVTIGGMSVPLQVIREDTSYDCEYIDFSSLPREQQSQAVVDTARAQRGKTYNLKDDAVLRVAACCVNPERWIVIVTLPAMNADRISMRHLVAELSSAYGRSVDTGIERLQYAEISDWQNELMSSSDTEQGRKYWDEADLRCVQPNLAFEARYRDCEFRPDIVNAEVTENTFDALRATKTSVHCLPVDLLLTCWSLLLSRYLDDGKVQIGVLADGRDFPELENSLGLLSRHIPIECQVESETAFHELVEEIALKRDEGIRKQQFFVWPDESCDEQGVPYPNYCFEYSDAPHGVVSRDVEFSIVKEYACVERFGLHLSCTNRGHYMDIDLHYDAERFDRRDVSSLLRQYLTLLEQVPKGLNKRVEEFGYLDECDIEHARSQSRVISEPIAKSNSLSTIHREFERRVALNPDRVALVDAGQHYTYGELNTWANNLAARLAQAGAEPGALVCIFLEQSAATVAAFLAALKSGCAYVPIDPRQPLARLREILEDAKPCVTITDSNLAEKLPLLSGHKVFATNNGGDLDRNDGKKNPDVECDPTSLAYVIYTSGSTGRPKGVAVEHRQLAYYVQAVTTELGLEEGLQYATGASFSVDLAYTALYPALLSGGLFHVLSTEQMLDSVSISNYFRQHPVDVLKITPSHLAALLDGADVLPRKVLVLGGETFTVAFLHQLREMAPDLEVVNHYGPTETTVGAAVFHCRRDAVDRRVQTVPIGRPLQGSQLYVLGAEGQPLPNWMTGELFIEGPGVARGYIGEDSLSESRFLGNPRRIGFDGRVYRSGDRARRLPDGNFEFVGRNDGQVKVRGHRIELGEIKAVLEMQASVHVAEVLARPVGDTNIVRRLLIVAYVVPSESHRSDPQFEQALLNELEGLLPSYMVPGRVCVMEALPRLPSGKVDQRALPELHATNSHRDRNITIPETDLEKRLLDVWSRVLGISEISIHDNFFELGGDSIHCIQVIGLAQKDGIRLSPAQIFEYPTIRELALVATRIVVNADYKCVWGRFPLTPIQHWFFSMKSDVPHHYNMSRMIVLKNRLDVDVIQQGLNNVVMHHDALRIRFKETIDGWLQYIGESVARVPVEEYDLRHVDPGELQAELVRHCMKVNEALNINDGPLIAAAYFDLDEPSHDRLFIAVHHLVIDSVSWQILLEDLDQACADASLKNSQKLPGKTVSYKQWAEELERAANSTVVKETVGYWANMVGRHISDLPTDFPEEPEALAVRTSSTYLASIDAETSRRIVSEVPRNSSVTTTELLMASLLLSLSDWTRKRDLLIDMENHGREALCSELDPSRTVGWFTARYPFLLRMNDEDGPADVDNAITRIQEEKRRLPMNGLTYGLLRYLCHDESVRGTLSEIPQPRISFNFLGRMDFRVDSAGDELQVFHSCEPWSNHGVHPNNRRYHFMKISGYIIENQLKVEWSYSSALFKESTIVDLAEAYCCYLRELVGKYSSGEYNARRASEFPQARISQEELDRFLTNL